MDMDAGLQKSVSDKAARFELLHRSGTFLLPNAWDPGSAMLLAEAGFQAIATTSSGIAFSQGLPDGEVLSRERMLELSARIIERVDLPVTVDMERGYGYAPEDVAASVRGVLAIGGAGCNIEDATHDPADPLIEFGLSVERVRAGVEAARASGRAFVFNARTDPYLGRPDHPNNFAETVRRGCAYRDAGAGCIFVPGLTDTTVLARLVREIGAPVNALAARGGRNNPVPLAAYREAGVRRVTIGGSLAQAAMGLVLRAAQQMMEQGDFGYATDGLAQPLLNKMMKPDA